MASHTAVMTLWTKPTRWRHEGAEELWSLSVLRLKGLVEVGHFDGLLLSTDRRGAEWASALGLPFNWVSPWLAETGVVNGLEKAWSAGKLATYTKVQKPFVHIDGDVLLRRSLPSHVMAADFLVERAERWCACGPDLEGWRLPTDWQAAADRCARLSWNFGILGGRAHGEIREAAKMALSVLRSNEAALAKARDGGWATVMVEQWGMARHMDAWRVASLLPLGSVASEAAGAGYRHLAADLKFQPAWRRKVAQALAEEWPGQSERCAEVARAFAP